MTAPLRHLTSALLAGALILPACGEKPTSPRSTRDIIYAAGWSDGPGIYMFDAWSLTLIDSIKGFSGEFVVTPDGRTMFMLGRTESGVTTVRKIDLLSRRLVMDAPLAHMGFGWGGSIALFDNGRMIVVGMCTGFVCRTDSYPRFERVDFESVVHAGSHASRLAAGENCKIPWSEDTLVIASLSPPRLLDEIPLEPDGEFRVLHTSAAEVHPGGRRVSVVVLGHGRTLYRIIDRESHETLTEIPLPRRLMIEVPRRLLINKSATVAVVITPGDVWEHNWYPSVQVIDLKSQRVRATFPSDNTEWEPWWNDLAELTSDGRSLIIAGRISPFEGGFRMARLNLDTYEIEQTADFGPAFAGIRAIAVGPHPLAPHRR